MAKTAPKEPSQKTTNILSPSSSDLLSIPTENGESSPESKVPESSQIEQAIKNLNISSNQLKYLGQGLYNVVYAYRDKVIKFTLSDRDVFALQTLKKLSSQVSYPNHLIQVDSIQLDPETQIYACIVERLEPLSSHLRSLLAGTARGGDIKKYQAFKVKKLMETKKTFLANFKDSKQYIKQYFQDILKIKSTFAPQNFNVDQAQINLFLDKIDRLDVDYLFELFHQKTVAHQFSFQTARAQYQKVFLQTLQTLLPTDNLIENHILNLLSEHFITNIYSLFRIYFPNYKSSLIDEETEFYSQQPETQTFLQTLHELSALGFHWNDLHTANIMMRPATGELVVSDPGLFYFS